MRRPEAAANMLDALLKSSSASTLSASDKSAVETKMSEAKAAAKWQKTPDHYKILAVERSCRYEFALSLRLVTGACMVLDLWDANSQLLSPIHLRNTMSTYALDGAPAEVWVCLLSWIAMVAHPLHSDAMP